MAKENDKFWTKNRIQKAQKLANAFDTAFIKNKGKKLTQKQMQKILWEE